MAAHPTDPPTEHRTDGETGQAIRFRAWNLLLLVPLLMLITSLYNRVDPTLFGIPFFYWSQLAFVFVGVLCVAVVYVKTRDVRGPASPPAPPTSADLAEGDQR